MRREADAKLTSAVAARGIAKVESEAAIGDSATGATCVAAAAAMTCSFVFIKDLTILVDLGFVHDDRRLVIDDFGLIHHLALHPPSGCEVARRASRPRYTLRTQG